MVSYLFFFLNNNNFPNAFESGKAYQDCVCLLGQFQHTNIIRSDEVLVVHNLYTLIKQTQPQICYLCIYACDKRECVFEMMWRE